MSYYSEAREYHDSGKYEEAYKLYVQGANEGDEKCYYGRALFLHDGYYVEEDKDVAAKIFAEHFDAILSLAENGDAEAMYIVACYYSNGFYVNEDQNKQIEWLSKSAEAGYSIAQLRLGFMYYDGAVVEPNLVKAHELYLASAEQNNSEAQWRLGIMYEYGEGIEENFEEAVKWYRTSAENGNSEGQWHLADMYQFGKGVEENFEEAVKWYRDSAENGNSEGQWHLADMYQFGKGVEENFEEAVKWYRKSAEQGNMGGQWRLGYMYAYAKGVEKNYNEAIKWLTVAAEQGESIAQFYLGIMHKHGWGCEWNDKDAEKWFRLSAEQGYYAAYTEVGNILLDRAFHLMPRYWDKRFSKKNDPDGKAYREACEPYEQAQDEAYKWFVYPAECGDVEAQSQLVFVYRYGHHGFEVDLEKAFSYLKNVVEHDPEILYQVYNLAEMYLYGEGTKVDYPKAAELLEYIIEKETNRDKDELKNSQWQLGLLYENGNGVPRDITRAIQLYEASYKNRSPIGAFYLARQYRSGEFIEQDIDTYFKLLKYAADKGVDPAINSLGKEYYSGEFKEKDYKKAFEIWSGGSVWNVSDETVGERHFYLGQCYHNCRGVDYDITDESTKNERLTKAKKHYKKALEYGFNCRLAYEMVKRDLGERGKGGKTREYAIDLLNTGVDKADLLRKIEFDLKKDFGEQWDNLKENAKKSLVSGMFYYVMNVQCGQEVCDYVDFTNVVATLSKALETELMEFFGRGYVEFLRDIKKIPADRFDPDYNGFVTYKNRIRKKDNIVYCDERNNFGFTLGALYYIIGVEIIPMEDPESLQKNVHRQTIETKRGTCVRTIKPYVKEYATLLFRKDAFGAVDFEEAVVNYLIDLAEDVRYIKEIRNPADHGTVVNCSHAEFCSDVLIKVYKVISELLDKISPEYIQKSLDVPIRTLENKTL